jgi:mobilome CxxCx(11)CxxC protein
MPANDELRNICSDNALYAFGTAYIFEKRASKYKKRFNCLTFLGIAVPALFGGFVLSFGAYFPFKAVIVVLISVLGLFQLVFSIWSLVAKWDDAFAYAQEAVSANYRLSANFNELAVSPPENLKDFETAFRLIKLENDFRIDRDNQQFITEREKRMGMRAGLRQFKRACATCKQVPVSLEPTNCDVCGNF